MADRKAEAGEANSFPESKEIKYSEAVSDLSNGSNEVDIGMIRSNHMNVVEPGFNAMSRDSQQKTESSCSNSLSAILPVSLSNNSFQETSKEAYSFRNYGGSTESSNSKVFDCQSEEPVTASSESGVSAQIARKAIRNARARNILKISSTAGSHGSLLNKKGNEEKWESRNTFSNDEQKDGTVGKSSVCLGNSDCFNCSNKTEENVRSCDEHDGHHASHSGERMISSEISGESENTLLVKSKAVEMEGKNKDDLQVNESSESSMIEPRDVSKKDRDAFVFGFDLNEDTNEIDDFVQPVVSSISSQSIVRAVAKAGLPRGLPMIPLKFEGGLGWKGSSETSAFRPAKCINYMPKESKGFTGIDLNVVAIEDRAVLELPMDHERISSSSVLQDSRIKQTKRLNFDLNCLSDAVDEFAQPSVPPELENPPLVDLNLNINTTEDRSGSFHGLGQSRQFWGNNSSETAIPRQQDFSFARRDYFADLSTMQHLPGNAHAQQYLVPAPFQPKLPFLPYALPPHGFPYKGPFHISNGEPVPPRIHLPYVGYSHENGHFHEFLNPGMAQASVGAPYLAHGGHGQSTINVTPSAPKLEVKTERDLLTNECKMDEAGQYLFLAKSSAVGDAQREVLYATSMKRKEPEGGLEHYQLGYRQVT